MAKPTHEQIYQYLLQRQVSPTHALGMLANIAGESSFDPAAIGDSGTSFGLFQWHGPRGTSLVSAVPDWKTNWQGQLDYALREPDTQKYLNAQFETPAQATEWFTRKWERPKNPDAAVAKRLAYLAEMGEMPVQTQETLPPTLGYTPVQLGPLPEIVPTRTQRMASNPFLQMGLGILAAGGNLGGAARGLQQAAQAEHQMQRSIEAQRAEELERRGQALYQQQIAQSYIRTLGRAPATQADILRATGRPETYFDPQSGRAVTKVWDPVERQMVDVPGMEGLMPQAATVPGRGQGKMTDTAAQKAGSARAVDEDLNFLISIAERPVEPVDFSGMIGIGKEWLGAPTLTSAGARALAGVVGYGLSKEEEEGLLALKRVENNLLQAMRGAQVGPREQTMFREQLPVPGSPNFLQALKSTRTNFRIARNEEARLKGRPLPYPDEKRTVQERFSELSGTLPPSFGGDFPSSAQEPTEEEINRMNREELEAYLRGE